MAEIARVGVDQSLSRIIFGLGVAGLLVPLVAPVALVLAMRQGEKLTEDQNISLGGFLGGVGTFIWLLVLLFFLLGGCSGPGADTDRSSAADRMTPETGGEALGPDGEPRRYDGMFGGEAALSDEERDRFRHIQVDPRAPEGEPDAAHLEIYPVRESWPARTTPPPSDQFDAEDWTYEAVRQGDFVKVEVKGVVVNRSGRDCRTMSLKAYCVDGYGEFLGEGGTVVRSVESRDPVGVDFTITITGIPVDANGRHAIDHVVLTRGRIFWAADN